MAKYYIQSGSVAFVVGACDVEGASLWAMHRIMDQKICEFEQAMIDADQDPYATEDLDQDIDGVPEAIPYDAMLDGLAEFGETILISQIGFGRDDAGEIETTEIFRQWRQLMQAVDRLYDQF